MNTSEMLDALAKIGTPHVTRTKEGAWWAGVEFPAPAGVTMVVRSTIDHPTHESALLQLIARLEGVVEMGKTAATIVIGSSS